LLGEHIARFLARNDVEVLVSLDGDRVNHDR
jgi:sulfatase maturation enzyme AslB (radical SAM superfamily)